MKLKQKRIISLFLAILMLFSVTPMETISASAMDVVTFNTKVTAFMNNRYANNSTYVDNAKYGGYQCFGFANEIATYIFGSFPTSSMAATSINSGWSRTYGGSAVDNLCVGDIVRYHYHSIFITGIDGSNIYYCQANVPNGTNKVTYNNKTTKSDLKSKVSDKLTSGGTDKTGWVAHYNNGVPNGPHVCSYSGSYFEAAHPHKVYQKCSCGKTKYTGATKAYSNCSTCMKLSTAYVMPVKAFTINTGKTTVYNTVSGTAKNNKIYDTDLCTISQIYDCGWCKVSFPLDSGGTETGYCKISVFMKGGGYTVYTSKQINTYRRSDLKTSNGYAGAGDKIYILGNTSSAVQIAYPLSAGGYKVGWVPVSFIKSTISYNANGGSGSMTSTFAQYNSTFALTANKFTKTGHVFSGWNVYRSSDKKWYVSGEGWKTASEISSKGYTKKLYKNQYSGTLSQPWISLGKTNDTYTFYAVWTPNKLTVNYNANGGTITSDTYKLSSNMIYKKADNAKLAQIWTYNLTQTNGLYNASTFGLSREGYTFNGWGTSASGGTVFDQNDAKLVPSSINSSIKNGNCSTTLYAIWTPKTYSVKFDANGGGGAPSAQTKTYGKNLTLSSTKPTRNGYNFLGWATSKTAASAAYQPVSSYTANSAVTLYAVWKADSTAPAHTHDWNTTYTVDKEPTCTQTGLKSIHCKICNEPKNTVTIPVIDHSYEIIMIEASCTEKGEMLKRCIVCDTETDKTEIPITEHYFVSTVTAEATCASAGAKEDVCSECGLHTNQETIPMIEHEFDEWEIETQATANRDGIEIRRCGNCDYTETRNIDYIPVYDEDTPRISMESVNAKVGEDVEIQIKMENNPGITALRFVVDYEEDVLEMTGFEFGNALSSMNKGTSDKYGTNYSFSMYSASSDLTDCGTIATIKFKVKNDVADGEYPITITYDSDDVFNMNGDCVHFDMEIGAIIIASCLRGDVNDDGRINMRDVVLLQQIINGWDVVYNNAAADYNGDGKINMRDIVALQQQING